MPGHLDLTALMHNPQVVALLSVFVGFVVGAFNSITVWFQNRNSIRQKEAERLDAAREQGVRIAQNNTTEARLMFDSALKGWQQLEQDLERRNALLVAENAVLKAENEALKSSAHPTVSIQSATITVQGNNQT